MDFFPFGAGVDDESGGVVPNNAPFAVAAGVGKLVFYRPVFALVLRQVRRSVGELSRGGGKRTEEKTRVVVDASSAPSSRQRWWLELCREVSVLSSAV